MEHYIYEIQLLMPGWEGKYYIGMHSTNKDPFNDGYTGSGDILKRYYKKYGKKEGVTYNKVILEFNKTSEINAIRERTIIADCYETDDRCINLKQGGFGGISKEAAVKISNSCKGRIPWNKGKSDIYSEETLNRMSNSAKIRTASEETKQKMSESHKNKKCKSIAVYDLNGVLIKTYNSIKDAINDGYCKSSITRCLNGKFRQHKQKIFKYKN